MTLTFNGNFPRKNGLYDPANEKDGCGVGFVCDIKGRPSHKILQDAFEMNCCMEHRGGVGYEKNTGDGAGVMTGMPHSFFNALAQELFGRELPKLESTVWAIFSCPQILLSAPLQNHH